MMIDTSECNNGRQTAVYVRVSGRRQDMRSQTPDLRKWLEAYADGNEVKWYQDKLSGRTMERPGWQCLERAIDAGTVETLIVWRLDRLGRTAAGLTALFDKLLERKVRFVSLRDGVDLATPAGRLIANVLASVAAYENEVRSERIAAGQAAARAAGKRWGGSRKGRRLKLTDEQIDAVHKLRAEGTRVSAIARTVGLSRQWVHHVLKTCHQPD